MNLDDDIVISMIWKNTQKMGWNFCLLIKKQNLFFE